jgi:hypothetical protein
MMEMEDKGMEVEEEANGMMKAINSMKQALSAIEKQYTMQQGTGLGEQDGNIGQAKNGEQGFSDDFENISKKALLKQKMLGA